MTDKSKELAEKAAEEVRSTFLDELAERYLAPQRQPGDFTAIEFGVKIHRPIEEAQKILDELVEKGELESCKTRAAKNGRGAVVYRKKGS
jgi:predicted ArsR family transcriptional regulator